MITPCRSQHWAIYVELWQVLYLHFLFSVRKWKKTSTIGGTGGWEFEVGEPLGPRNLESAGLMESNANVGFTTPH